MAPIGHSATAQAETAIRDTIQSLYNVMLHTSAYDAAGSHTSLDALVAEVRILSQALRDVNEVVEKDNDGSGPNSVVTLDSTGTGHRNLPSVPRDLVQYVEAGRNPDIYTREFVELVRRTNQLRAGKRGAFAQFRDTLAGQIRSALPELGGDVDRVMGATAENPGQSGEPGGEPGGEPHTAPGSTQPAASLDGSSKTTLVGEAETPGSHRGSASAATAGTVAPAGTAATHTTATVPASASASASPLAHPGSGSNQAGAGTPSAHSDAGSGTGSGGPHAASSAPTTIDMMGILPSTPQPISAAGGGTASGSGSGAAAGGGAASGEGGASGSGGDGGQDAMETS